MGSEWNFQFLTSTRTLFCRFSDQAELTVKEIKVDEEFVVALRRQHLENQWLE